MKKIIKNIFSYAGYNISKKSTSSFPIDYSDDEVQIIQTVKPYTMTSHQRICTLIRAIQYIVSSDIQGDFVECGVWKGGSIMAMAMTLKKLNSENREIFLFDTFSGMSSPTNVDIDWHNKNAKEIFSKSVTEEGNIWCSSNMDEVKKNLSLIDYPQNKFHFIEGKVEDTLNQIKCVPEKIALLRLDTDFYESTKSEMEYLFPKLMKGGILIIDDYGSWRGSKLAIDEYLEKNNLKLFLNRIDETGRLIVITNPA